MNDPLVKKIDALIEEFSAPEVVEAIVTIARHYRRKFQRQLRGEAQGWMAVESAMSEALTKIEG
jgi:hypothetical protein